MVDSINDRSPSNTGSPGTHREFKSKEEILEAAKRGCVKFFNVSLSTLKEVYENRSEEVTTELLLLLAVMADEDISLVSEKGRALTAAYRLEHPGHIY